MKIEEPAIFPVSQPLTEDLISNYVNYADIFEAPIEAHEAAVRTVIAAAANPSVYIQNGGQKLSLDTWTLLLSPSGLGRNTLVSMMRGLLKKAELGDLLRNSSWGSVQGMFQDLAENPSAFLVWEELAANLKTLSDARFGNAKEWLTDRYDNFEIPSAITYRRTGKSNDTPTIDFNQAPRICEIEEELRYRYVKYTSIYLQVLSVVLREKGESEAAEKLLPIHMFLEFGASDKCLINLMSLGLSRTSAILLKRTVSLGSDMTLQECKQYLDAVNLTRIAIPAICKAEISRMRGRSSQ